VRFEEWQKYNEIHQKILRLNSKVSQDRKIKLALWLGLECYTDIFFYTGIALGGKIFLQQFSLPVFLR